MKSKILKGQIIMKKYCLCVCVERDICEPEYFDTHEEAYNKMKEILIKNIIDSDSNEEFLTKENELIDIEKINQDTERKFELQANFMWSNLDDDYDIDAKIFEIEFL